MRRAAPLLAVLALAALLAGCTTPTDETWIGKNVGVAVDSSAEARPDDAR